MVTNKTSLYIVKNISIFGDFNYEQSYKNEGIPYFVSVIYINLINRVLTGETECDIRRHVLCKIFNLALGCMDTVHHSLWLKKHNVL
jgi:predicted membrane metal-binding protein